MTDCIERPMETFDVAIVGAGPAGSSCAAFCALDGLRTLVLEREKFPREKVCGDCLNPSSWGVLRRLGIADRARQLPHAILSTVEFIAIGGQKVIVGLPSGEESLRAIKRSLFDALVMSRARDGKLKQTRAQLLPRECWSERTAAIRQWRAFAIYSRGPRVNASRCNRTFRCRRVSAVA